MSKIELYNVGKLGLDNDAYAVDVKDGDNIKAIENVMLEHDFLWTQEKINDFEMMHFRNIDEVIKYFGDTDEAEEVLSSYLTANIDINPKNIPLEYANGILFYQRKNPWEMSENEKALREEELKELLINVASFLGA